MKLFNISLDLGGSTLRSTVDGKVVDILDSKTKHVTDVTIKDISIDPYGEFRIIQSPLIDLVNSKSDFYVKGESGANYSGLDIFPHNQEKKVKQDATFINMMYAIGYSLSKYSPKVLNSVPVAVAICVPAKERYEETTGETFIHNISGDYCIEFPRLNSEYWFNLNAKTILLQSEGVVSFSDYIQKERKVDYAKRKTFLVIDAGYRSTEIVLIGNQKSYTYSAASPALGGITLESEVEASSVSSGYFSQDIRRVVATGEIIHQGVVIAAGSAVRAAKQQLANRLIPKIIEVTSKTREVENINNISDLFVTGRCFHSEGFGDKETGDLSMYLLKGLNLNIPVHRSNPLGESNVLGAYNQLIRYLVKNKFIEENVQ